jgi:hypothetical protein
VGLHPRCNRAEPRVVDGGKSGNVVRRLRIFKESGIEIVTRPAVLYQCFVTAVDTQLVTPLTTDRYVRREAWLPRKI